MTNTSVKTQIQTLIVRYSGRYINRDRQRNVYIALDTDSDCFLLDRYTKA